MNDSPIDSNYNTHHDILGNKTNEKFDEEEQTRHSFNNNDISSNVVNSSDQNHQEEWTNQESHDSWGDSQEGNFSLEEHNQQQREDWQENNQTEDWGDQEPKSEWPEDGEGYSYTEEFEDHSQIYSEFQSNDLPLKKEEPAHDEQELPYQCVKCYISFATTRDLALHSAKVHLLDGVDDKPDLSELLPKKKKLRGCFSCGIPVIKNRDKFERHHIKHIKRQVLELRITKLSEEAINSFKVESGKRKKRGRKAKSVERSRSPSPSRDDGNSGIKLTLKLSHDKKSKRGRKKRTAEIVRSEGMSSSLAENTESNGSDDTSTSENQEFNAQEQEASDSYQPQFESLTEDWYDECDSESRIAAAMAGSTSTEAEENSWPNGSAGGTPSSGSPSNCNEDSNGAGGGSGDDQHYSNSDGDGLFSQEVLGNQGSNESQTQGSFEELCLNDSFGGQSQNHDENSQNSQDSNHSQHNQNEHGGDLFSQLDYLNSDNSHTSNSPHMNGSPHSNASNNSNSRVSTPNSAGQPTPPPNDTSFRALATSPNHDSQSSMSGSNMQQNSQVPSQPEHSGPRLTIANNLMAPVTSSEPPLANNYQNNYHNQQPHTQQWSQPVANAAAAATSAFTNYNAPNITPNIAPNMAPSIVPNMGNMAGGMRPTLQGNMPMSYRPSPPARIRGRPPLSGGMGRAAMHQAAGLRGPGRPPGSTVLPPPLMPVPGGRGSSHAAPVHQRNPAMFAGGRGQPGMHQGQKRPLPGGNQANHSPSKSTRREDINVPARQKDTECQIIAVANRGDGLPVIANVQGGNNNKDSRDSNRSSSSSSTPTTSESTIHLSDSITLSVRSPAAKETPRNDKSGPDAGVVANLLASRGITVAPAAGEKNSDSGGREERRLPTANELNLSSAISVHPPTSRDRDGFAVPAAPPSSSRSSNSSSSSSNSSSNSSKEPDRPPRPPTVDLTQDVPTHGGSRHPCSQCDKTFPNSALLADHQKDHEKQKSSRMPYKCHLCTAGFSSQKGQQHHYSQFHQLNLSSGDIAIPVVDLRNSVNVQRMTALGVRSFIPLSNLQNRGAGGVVGIPLLTLDNLRNGQMSIQQWGVTDVLSLGPAKTINTPRAKSSPPTNSPSNRGRPSHNLRGASNYSSNLANPRMRGAMNYPRPPRGRHMGPRGMSQPMGMNSQPRGMNPNMNANPGNNYMRPSHQQQQPASQGPNANMNSQSMTNMPAVQQNQSGVMQNQTQHLPQNTSPVPNVSPNMNTSSNSSINAAAAAVTAQYTQNSGYTLPDVSMNTAVSQPNTMMSPDLSNTNNYYTNTQADTTQMNLAANTSAPVDSMMNYQPNMGSSTMMNSSVTMSDSSNLGYANTSASTTSVNQQAYTTSAATFPMQ